MKFASLIVSTSSVFQLTTRKTLAFIRRSLGVFVFVCLALFSGVAAIPALAQAGPDGYDFVTVGAPNNPAYFGEDPFNLVTGRGSVGYEYKIGRTEVTTAQWVEFYNAAYARPDPLPFSTARWFGRPVLWGGAGDPTYTGPGRRYRVATSIPNAAMLPVSGIPWRTAAILCNLLENGKGTAQSDFMNGAYDVTTFTPEHANPTFNDQVAHNPSARYWIPTLDEWMKAVHYDPNGNGPGQGRWWQQPNGSDTPLIYGPPTSFGGNGTGQANAGFRLTNHAEYDIPLGSYPEVQSPWGLLDAAGATDEWMEDIFTRNGVMYRMFDGTGWGSVDDSDFVWGYGADYVDVRDTDRGFRIASSIPGPASATVFLFLGGMCVRRIRRRCFR